MINKEKLINDLRNLYNQNTKFINNAISGTSEKHYKKKTIAEFTKLNNQLNDYIQDIDFGLECDKDLSDWCDLFAGVLLDDFGIDDDNFPKGGW